MSSIYAEKLVYFKRAHYKTLNISKSKLLGVFKPRFVPHNLMIAVIFHLDKT